MICTKFDIKRGNNVFKSFKRLGKYIKPYSIYAIAAPLLMIVAVIVDLYQPALMQQMIDIGIRDGDFGYVMSISAKMLILAVIGFIGMYSSVILSNIAAFSFSKDFRRDLFSKIQNLSFNSIDQYETGTIITRLTNDITQVQDTFGLTLRMAIRAPLMLVGSIFMAIRTAPSISWIMLVIGPVLFLIIAKLLKISFPLYTTLQEKIDTVNSIAQENFSGIRVVKAFVKSDYEKQRFEKANQELQTITMKASRLMALLRPFMFLIINFCIVAVLWFGGRQIFSGELMVGSILAFINYLSRLLFSMMMINMVLIRMSRAAASTDRIFEMLDLEKHMTNTSCPIKDFVFEGKVEFRNVSFSYDNSDTPVLKDISFVANPGETIAIMGATGSGKSTLIQLLPRFYDPQVGEILIDGVNIKDLDLNQLRSQIGFSLQQTNLFSGTILDNITYGNERASLDDAIEVAKIAQAHPFIDALPNKYYTQIEQRGVNLSGGQKQRIAIARALLIQPKLLVLDDSTSAVDVTTEAKIQKELHHLMSNTTSFTVAQRVSTVLEADRILILDEGQIADIGSHKELLEGSSLYKEILLSQLGEEGFAYVS